MGYEPGERVCVVVVVVVGGKDRLAGLRKRDQNERYEEFVGSHALYLMKLRITLIILFS